MAIFRLVQVVHLVLDVCSILGVISNTCHLILPWLIFAWFQCSQYIGIVIYEYLEKEYLNAVLVVCYLPFLAMCYILLWRYFQQLRNNHQEKLQVVK